MPTRDFLAALEGFFLGAEGRFPHSFLEELDLHLSGALFLRIANFLAVRIDRQGGLLRMQRKIEDDAPGERHENEQASTHACFPAVYWGCYEG